MSLVLSSKVDSETVQVCSRCALDTTDPNIRFDELGVCNYCRLDERVKPFLPTRKMLDVKIEEIKDFGRGKKYDCMLGFSGGIDSCSMAYYAKKFGLRVLLVHASNGFDSPIAQHNIRMVREHTGYDFVERCVDEREFADLQRAYLWSGVLDLDIPADEAIEAVNYGVAKEFGLKWWLDGFNHNTEFIVPKAWTYYRKNDLVNLKSIHKHWGTVKLKSFPLMGAVGWWWNRNVRRFRRLALLNFVDYRKKDAIKLLAKEWDIKFYGHKHYENVLTRFYQGYILPERWGIDKRKSHLSSLIRDGELTRDEVLAELKKDPYDATDVFGVHVDAYRLEDDRRFVLGRLGVCECDFNAMMTIPTVPHEAYGTDQWFYDLVGFYKGCRHFVGEQLRRVKRHLP